jgi:hypothetical protein
VKEWRSGCGDDDCWCRLLSGCGVGGDLHRVRPRFIPQESTEGVNMLHELHERDESAFGRFSTLHALAVSERV